MTQASVTQVSATGLTVAQPPGARGPAGWREGVATPPGRRRASRIDGWCLVLALVSGGLVAVGRMLGWRGVDLPAQLYRVQQFRAHGFTLWDSQWYSGHWTLDYSVLYPPLAVLVGVSLLAVLSAAVATAAFDRIVVRRLGPGARLGSAAFAVSVIVSTSIGQLAFFTGEAFGLACLWALVGTRRRWALAGGLALASTLSSPLAGAFLALALAVWCLAVVTGPRRLPPAGDPEAVVEVEASWGRRRAREIRSRCRSWRGDGWRLATVCAVAVAPIGATSVLFPGQGPMPYPVIDWVWEMVVALLAWGAAPARLRVLRIGIGLYLLALSASVALPSALGGNIGRMEDAFAVPVVLACCWARRDGTVAAGISVDRLLDHLGLRGRRRLAYRLASGALAVPLVLSQWTPAWPALTSDAGQAWTQPGYYAPLVSWLSQAVDAPPVDAAPAGTAGGPVPGSRVEVVPTLDHWEAAYVAPAVPLVRGWERQLDVADNPLFYGKAPLTPATYLAWLEDNGARYVALSGGPLDPAGVAEAALIDAGVPGLRPVWRNADWRVYQVVGGPGIVSGAARLTGMQGDRVDLDATAAGSVLVRVRWAAHWKVTSGAARLAPAAGGWTTVTAARPGPVALRASLGL